MLLPLADRFIESWFAGFCLYEKKDATDSEALAEAHECLPNESVDRLSTIYDLYKTRDLKEKKQLLKEYKKELRGAWG